MNSHQLPSREMQKEWDAFLTIRHSLGPVLHEKGITSDQLVAHAQREALLRAGFECGFNALTGHYIENVEITKTYFAHQFPSGQVISCAGYCGWDAIKHSANLMNKEMGLGPFIWDPVRITSALLLICAPHAIPDAELGPILDATFASIERDQLSGVTPPPLSLSLGISGVVCETFVRQ